MSIILHLDMNSYFASVEQQFKPHLRGRPVGVCEHLKGIIIAPSVEAKRLGIKLGTLVWEAQKIFPNIVLLPTDPDKYRHVTALFLKILHDYSDRVEKYSIDEAFVDITMTCRGYDDALLLGLEIKQRIRQEVGEWISCSIGIGPNKLLAKIAADLDGGVLTPALSSLRRRGRKGEEMIDRICVIKPEQINLLYDLLKLTDVPGIGERTKAALNKLGIFTLKELAEYPLENLLTQFGIWGYVLHGLAHFSPPHDPFGGAQGHLERSRNGEEGLGEVIENYDPLFISPSRGGETSVKSIGHMYTLPKPIREIKAIKGLMLKLSEKVGRRMRRISARGNVVHYFDTNFSKQKKLRELICDGRDIYKAAWRIYKKGEGELLPIKIMGISVSGLIFGEPLTPLFENYKKPIWLTQAMDRINDKYGEFAIVFGRLLDTPEEWAKDTVGFGRTKS